ncbi:hypothetical protein [Acetobacter cerevisiae]|uniref:Uncharacterized protein n=1 Tax=Acetobacter cerevisiae TaxID=178900 RepID=A0A149QYH0_9PROT|nr:hypothetical protein [Acetobacter cerevisiae]KXV02359.1 hypothetical protein AD928_01015 [Acetobacter cerevisiae]GBQ09045.1 hypothetical protein AA14362_2143 [Acetobacter cerevisiae DSM 14362]
MQDYVTGDIFTFNPPQQTLAAWKPFWDCVTILFQFQNSDVDDGGEELKEWRLFWVAGLALLRTVGHVLDKVDAKKTSPHGKVIFERWKQWKNDKEQAEIFWNFIEKERNSLLKTYSFGARFVNDPEGAYIEFEDGSDAFQLYRQAVYWWRKQLIEIEQSIHSN